MQLSDALHMADLPEPNAKQLHLIQLYRGEANRNATQAARLAGYGSARVVGPKLIKKYRHVIERLDAEEADRKNMGPSQVMQKLAVIADDPTHKDHIRALELLSRIHGLLSDKAVADKRTMNEQLEQILKPAKANVVSFTRKKQAKAAMPVAANS